MGSSSLAAVNEEISAAESAFKRRLTETERETIVRAHGFVPKRPRFSKPEVRDYARSVLRPDARYEETAIGLTVKGRVTAPGLRPLEAECKVGEENRMRTGFIRALADGKVRDGLVP